MNLVLAEEPYDGAVGRSLIDRMLQDINERYAHLAEGMTPRERAAADADYLAEVTADDVTRLGGAFVVARLDGTPVGCGALKRYVPYDGSAPPAGVAEVKRMYTAAEARRRGVAAAILARLEAIAVELGYEQLLLETGVPQPEAIALYERAGWSPVPPYGHYRDSPLSRCFTKRVGP